MDKILGVILGIVLIMVMAVLGGSIVWIVWPTAVLAFPALVDKGYLVAEITWPTAVCLSYLCALLIKSTATSSSD